MAWLTIYLEVIRQLTAYADHISTTGDLAEIEELVVRIGVGEYLAQIFGGIPMSQSEIAHPTC